MVRYMSDWAYVYGSCELAWRLRDPISEEMYCTQQGAARILVLDLGIYSTSSGWCEKKLQKTMCQDNKLQPSSFIT